LAGGRPGIAGKRIRAKKKRGDAGKKEEKLKCGEPIKTLAP